MTTPLRVLIVEDTPADAELMVLRLVAEGFQPDWQRVQTEPDYMTGLATPPDLILADWRLPQFSGLRALQLMCARGLDIPFVIVSGSIGEEAAVDALRQGAYDYVLKDRPIRLGQAVRHALEDKRLREERQRAQQELVRSHQQLRALAAHLQSVRESERAAIAREIHDELGQLLTALKFDLFWLKTNLKRSPTATPRPVSTKITDMIKLVEETIDSVRRIAAKLRPAVLDELGLDAAIEWHVKEFTQQTGIHCVVNSAPQPLNLSPEQSIGLFRILQEALTNVARHANATRVQISLKTEGTQLRLEIQDNGKGIAESQLAQVRSLGILGMEERARLLGGEVKITGAPRQGMTVRVEIPIHPVDPAPVGTERTSPNDTCTHSR